MKRTLEKNVMSAVLKSWGTAGRGADTDGAVAVRIRFPAGAFAQAPVWSPGEDFDVCRAGQAWIRRTPELTTAVVAGARLPLRTAGAPDGAEVWTVSGPPDRVPPAFLWQDPARVTGLRRTPEADIVREQLAGHPAAEAAAHWTQFEEEWGFRPELKDDGRWSLLLPCLPGRPATRPNERELVDAAAAVVRRFGGTAKVEPHSEAGDLFAVWRILEAAAARMCAA
ncbi:hypothetical protein [Kitasatospora griseola]|uniref:hypothetical protein n=1 Tax=Kitasatospora griseola TaxID=2064 RepID=UPI00342194AC